MQTINISDFRANLLKYLEKANSGEQFCVTTNGKVIATVTPPIEQKTQAASELAELAKGAVLGDVTSTTGSEWDANL